MDGVQLFSVPNCPWCQRTKQMFRRRGIDFVERDITEDERAQRRLMKMTGRLKVPVVNLDGQIIIGFNRSFLRHALGHE